MRQPDTAAARAVRPAILCILDGWGLRPDAPDNAIARARTPVWDGLWASGALARLDASARAVGLPAGQMGNSEVGHISLGAGRVVAQGRVRIDAAVADGTLARHPALLALAADARQSGGVAHVMGLLSDGGVHAHQDHMAAVARVLGAAGARVKVHAFLDGRDTPPRSARDCLRRFAAAAPGLPVATVCGRYYAMDRDQNWDRTARACRAIALGEGARTDSAEEAVEAAWAAGQSDEFAPPAVVGDYPGMRAGDAIVMANFRADRARQILAAFVEPDFTGFDRGGAPCVIPPSRALGMVSYGGALSPHMTALFPPEDLADTLGAAVAARGLRQLRLAETEKYAHVTFFLSGGREEPFPGEDRILAPSPKVATYDLAPEMAAAAVTDHLVKAVDGRQHALMVVNYANADMVGHTGDLSAAVRAVECLDGCLGRVRDAARRAGAALLVTADHGNVEKMTDAASGQAHTAHTLNLVPLALAHPDWAGRGPLPDDTPAGTLADVAPTVLDLMGLPRPSAMTGRSWAPPGLG